MYKVHVQQHTLLDYPKHIYTQYQHLSTKFQRKTIKMKFSIMISALLTTTVSAAAIPEAASAKGLEARQETGSYTISDLGARKQQVTAAGASSFNMAIAMLETERMDTNVRYLPQPLYSESLH